jgi:hypothetical protein
MRKIVDGGNEVKKEHKKVELKLKKQGREIPKFQKIGAQNYRWWQSRKCYRKTAKKVKSLIR